MCHDSSNDQARRIANDLSPDHLGRTIHALGPKAAGFEPGPDRESARETPQLDLQGAPAKLIGMGRGISPLRGFPTRARLSRSRGRSLFDKAAFRVVDRLLARKWSPQQISGYLREANILSISHETIYRHVWLDRHNGGDLHQHMRCAVKQRRKRHNSRDSRGRLAGKRHISERPPLGRDATENWTLGDRYGGWDQHQGLRCDPRNGRPATRSSASSRTGACMG